MSLKNVAVGGVFWTFLQQFGSQIINFGVSIVLARLLLPKDFGTIALMDIIMGVGSVIVSSGLTNSLIRTKDADDRDYSTVFYFNLIASVVIYAITYILAPYLADFYDLPILVPLTRVYCLSFIIGAFSTVQATVLTKAMEFKKLMQISIPSLLMSGVVGVLMAYSGYGVWSLIGSSLTLQIVKTVQFWYFSEWKPKIIFDYGKLKEHFAFGSNMLVAALINIVFQNGYTLIIGKMYSFSELGYYNRANSIKDLPVNNISNALNKVSFPLFAKIKDDNITLRRAYIKLMKMVVFIVAPIMFFIIVFAEPIILLLLTEKWLEVAPYLQILSLSAILYPIQFYNLNILSVKGRSDLYLRLDIIKKVVIVIAILTTINFGVIGLLWGQVMTSVISLLINSYYSGKFINLDLIKQLKMLMPSIFISASVGGALYFIKKYFLSDFNDILIVLIGGFLFFSIYLVINKVINNESLEEMILLIKERGNFKNKT
ncbi:lipopolysaccharide biosynthesis protein [Aequorivita sediminis]|uniref:lipopolysaccharide biosynthesis protein n=1 Tax=Aequorivita sediminis TaxID=3073653 RepID=UPI0028AC3AE2|nr:lipopolysaccharide biosynthesis protein [Aequorivita sp. F6058]